MTPSRDSYTSFTRKPARLIEAGDTIIDPFLSSGHGLVYTTIARVEALVSGGYVFYAEEGGRAMDWPSHGWAAVVS